MFGDMAAWMEGCWAGSAGRPATFCHSRLAEVLNTTSTLPTLSCQLTLVYTFTAAATRHSRRWLGRRTWTPPSAAEPERMSQGVAQLKDEVTRQHSLYFTQTAG